MDLSEQPSGSAQSSSSPILKEQRPIKEMVADAILSLNNRNGSSFSAISGYILQNYAVKFSKAFNTRMKNVLGRGVEEEVFVQKKRSFKLSRSAKAEWVGVLQRREQRRRSKAASRSTDRQQTVDNDGAPLGTAEATASRSKDRQQTADDDGAPLSTAQATEIASSNHVPDGQEVSTDQENSLMALNEELAIIFFNNIQPCNDNLNDESDGNTEEDSLATATAADAAGSSIQAEFCEEVLHNTGSNHSGYNFSIKVENLPDSCLSNPAPAPALVAAESCEAQPDGFIASQEPTSPEDNQYSDDEDVIFVPQTFEIVDISSDEECFDHGFSRLIWAMRKHLAEKEKQNKSD